MTMTEVQFDGLPGPTHHYGGLSAGNRASQRHRRQTSHPREAALQVLAKVKQVAELGVPQFVLPPHPRPHLAFLRSQGFSGSDADVIGDACRTRPDLLSIAYSSAAMWSANAATVSPTPDAEDGLLHLTPANLWTTTHRRIEVPFTERVLRHLFSDVPNAIVHSPLKSDENFADEGAANHMRLTDAAENTGLEIFVFGRGEDARTPLPTRFPARQTQAACRQIAAQHDVLERSLIVQQNPQAIDAGAFHNDVVAVSHRNLLLIHERALLNQSAVLENAQRRLNNELDIIQVSERELSLDAAVSTYLFNSQILSPQGNSNSTERVLLCPQECVEHPATQGLLQRILEAENPIHQVIPIEVRQSMRNGGGPACLRLRVLMTDEQRCHLPAAFCWTEDLHRQLSEWIQRHYRESLEVGELGDPQLLNEARRAFDELAKILKFPDLAEDPP